jgi:hypothetical protein
VVSAGNTPRQFTGIIPPQLKYVSNISQEYLKNNDFVLQVLIITHPFPALNKKGAKSHGIQK